MTDSLKKSIDLYVVLNAGVNSKNFLKEIQVGINHCIDCLSKSNKFEEYIKDVITMDNDISRNNLNELSRFPDMRGIEFTISITAQKDDYFKDEDIGNIRVDLLYVPDEISSAIRNKKWHFNPYI